MTPGTALVLALALGGSAYGVNAYINAQDEKKRKERSKKKTKDKPAPTPRPTPIFAENATLGNSPKIVQQIVPPIELGELGIVQVRTNNKILNFASLAIQADKTIGHGKVLAITPGEALKGLVTNLSPSATATAWDELKRHIKLTGGVLFDVPSYDVDRVVRDVLKKVNPSVDWSKAPGSFPDAVTSKLWSGVMLLGQLYYQSIWNEYTAQEESNNGLIPPYPTPSPTPPEKSVLDPKIEQAWDNFYAKGELQGSPLVIREFEIGPSAAGFYAEAKVFDDDTSRSTGTYTGVSIYHDRASEQVGSFVLYGPDPDDLAGRLRNTTVAKQQSFLA